MQTEQFYVYLDFIYKCTRENLLNSSFKNLKINMKFVHTKNDLLVHVRSHEHSNFNIDSGKK